MYFLSLIHSLLTRLFTHGYVFYTPPEAVVYHLYSRSHRPVIQTDHSQAGREMISETATKTRYTWRKRSNIEVSTMKQRAQARVKAMLGMSPKEDLGMYGLGNERTLSDFEIYIGVNFSKQIVECSVIANDPQADGYRSKWSAFISQELPTGCRYEILQQNLMIPQHGGDIIKSIMDSLGMDH